MSLSASVKPEARRSALRYATRPSADIDQSPVTGSSTTISRAIVQRDRWATGDLDSAPLRAARSSINTGSSEASCAEARPPAGTLSDVPSAEQGRSTSSGPDQRGHGQCAQRPPPAGADAPSRPRAARPATRPMSDRDPAHDRAPRGGWPGPAVRSRDRSSFGAPVLAGCRLDLDPWPP